MSVKRNDNHGRRTRTFERIKAQLRMQRGPCHICAQPIDYSLPPSDPQAFTVDHVLPRSTHPWAAEDPANCRSAHAKCNKSRGAGPVPDHGVTSEEW